MSGRPNKKWMETMIRKHGSREAVTAVQAAIGAKGGKLGHTGGFSYPNPCDCRLIDAPHFIRQCAGVIGGRKSRRTKKVVVADGVS